MLFACGREEREHDRLGNAMMPPVGRLPSEFCFRDMENGEERLEEVGQKGVEM
jgi:hypothetical protein